MSKVRIRLQGAERDVAKLRKHLLKHHPQMVLAHPREPVKPRSILQQRVVVWSSFGDYEFGKIRRRRNQ